MKNKYIVLILMAALFTGSLAGCQTHSEKQPTQEFTSIADSENTEEENTDLSAKAAGGTPASDTLPENTAQASSDAKFSMDEQVLLEYEGITVKAISWNPDTFALKIQAQNTTDQDYIIQFSSTSINDYMMEPMFSLNVNANSQAEKDAEFNPSNLSECGIKEASQIQMKVNLVNAVSFDTLHTSDYVTVQTSASSYEETDKKSGEMLYDQEGLQLISQGFVDDPDWGKLWKVYISNNTEEDLIFYAPTITLNGNTLDVLFSVDVPAGKKAVGTMTIFQEDLDTYQINDITSAALTLQLQNPNTFTTVRTIEINDIAPDSFSR